MDHFDMCRVCLTTETNMLPLDDNFVLNYNLLTNLNIGLSDGMPQHCCITCVNTIKYFAEFREKSITSEKTLREIVYSNIKSKSKNLVIELERKPPDINAVLNIKPEIKEELFDSTLDHFDDAFSDFDEEDLKNIIVAKKEEDIKPKRKRGRPKKSEVIIKKRKKNLEVKIKTAKLLKQITDELENVWLCGICPMSFGNKVDVINHLDTHKNDRQCGLCRETANSLSQLLAHRLKHVTKKQCNCHICDRKFVQPMYLELHFRQMHIEGENTGLACSLCPNKSFNTPKKYKNHISHVHSELRYFCDYCKKGFRNKSCLKSHIKQHSDNKAYVCDLCGFSCKYSGGLHDHKVRKHTPSKIYCKTCKRPFESKEKHDAHKCTIKYNVCPLCGLQLSGNARLSKHMQQHSDIKNYECKRCPAKFKTKNALKVHNDKHDGNPTKQCEYCNAKFYNGSVLIKHRRIHTGEKPYVCKICHKGFTGNHNLKVHMKVHGLYNLVVKRNCEPEDIKDIAKLA